MDQCTINQKNRKEEKKKEKKTLLHQISVQARELMLRQVEVTAGSPGPGC